MLTCQHACLPTCRQTRPGVLQGLLLSVDLWRLEEGENNGSIEVEKAVDTYLSLHRSNRKKKAL